MVYEANGHVNGSRSFNSDAGIGVKTIVLDNLYGTKKESSFLYLCKICITKLQLHAAITKSMELIHPECLTFACIIRLCVCTDQSQVKGKCLGFKRMSGMRHSDLAFCPKQLLHPSWPPSRALDRLSWLPFYETTPGLFHLAMANNFCTTTWTWKGSSVKQQKKILSVYEIFEVFKTGSSHSSIDIICLS